MNKQQIETILKENGLAPLKSKGQNFLIDGDVAQKIVSHLDPYFDNVLEIGPGLGSLTAPLLLKTTKLTSVEIDQGYVKYLQNTYRNVNIVASDFLKYDVPRETKSVIGNLPYYITTKLIEKVILETPNLEVFVFMVEAGVRERLLADVGTKEYGPLRVLLSILGKTEAKIIVTADKFYPRPRVDSLVFKFTRGNKIINAQAFYTFVKDAFFTRRKTLFNNLSRNHDKNAVNAALAKFNIKPSVRAEALSPEILFTLFNELT